MLASSRNKRLVRCAEILLDGKLDILHSHIDYKPPGSGDFLPHQDNYYNQVEPPDAIIACWVGLEDSDERNGALFMYPKSHQEPILPVRNRCEST